MSVVVCSTDDGGDGMRGSADILEAARAATFDYSLITDARQAITHVSASFVAMTGYEQGDLFGKNCRVLQGPGTDPGTRRQIRELLGSGQVFDGKILNYRKDGSAFWTALKIIPMREGQGTEVTHYVSVQRDITNDVALLKHLQAQAMRDHVTGLPNRAAAEQALENAVERFPEQDMTVAVGLIDLDDFRDVNNTFGHAAGDSVLQQWASRVTAGLRDGDLLARMGGDEFLLILGNVSFATSDEDLPGIMYRIHEAVEEPFTVQGHQVHLGMSMGVALIPREGTDSRIILHSADEALYTAKKRRAQAMPWWQSAVDPLPVHAQTTAEIPRSPQMYRSALRNGNVLVHFQPIIDLREGSVVLFEALARLHLPGERIAFPDEFLPHLTAEDLRILFDDVLNQALGLIAGWDREGVRPNVAVNLPPEILNDSTLPAMVERTLRAYHIEPGGLGLELLESQTMELEKQRAALQDFAGYGIRLAMDDLGSGYSSLQRLSSFPFTAIKLDRGLFLHAYDRPLESLSIMTTLIQMGRDLGMTVVVEGLEDESLTEVATVLGAPLGQGYFFSKPMPGEDCGPWVDSFEPYLHTSHLRTPLGALAYHWQFARLAAPHVLDLERCPLTRFIHEISTNPGFTSGSDVDSWHALHHMQEATNPASSGLLTDWLTQLIKSPQSPGTSETSTN